MSFPLEQITRVRWGAVKYSVNGIPTGTDYTICFGDNYRLANVATKRQDIFENFIDKLRFARWYSPDDRNAEEFT